MNLILGPVEQLLPLANTTHHLMSEKGAYSLWLTEWERGEWKRWGL